MGKLGLIIKNTSGGEQEAYAINRNETWVRFASDARSLIKEEFTNFDGTGKSVYFLKFLGKLGYFIGVVKARPAGSGRDWDNTAAWIFVPANVEISGEEEENVIRTVERAISGEKEIDTQALYEEFSKDFKEKEVLFTPIYEIASSREGSVACRFYGRGTDYTLKELLGNRVAQSEYKEYRAVFLLDKEQDISISNGNVLNIKLSEICRVLPPVCGDLSQECKDFKPYLSDDVVFDKAIEVYAGRRIDVTWKRDGFEPIPKSCTVSSEDNGKALPELLISPMECIRRIPVSVISVYDTHGKEVVGYDLRINGKPVMGEYIEIPEALYNDDCEIKVTKPEYEPYSGTMNFAHERQKRVTLRPRVHRYEFLIPCYNGKEYIDDYMLYIESEHCIQESPVKGYTLKGERVYEGKGGRNRLKKNILEPIIYFCYGFLSCVIILLLYTGWKALGEYEFSFAWPPIKHKEQIEKFPPVVKNEEKKFEGTQSDEKAIAYLNRETTWHKDSLNKYPLLEGLYDDLNEMNLVKIRNEWKDKLISVSIFSRIAFNASRALNNGWNVKQGEHDPTFTNDSIINVKEYIEWLSRDQTPAQSPSSGNNITGNSHGSESSGDTSNNLTVPAEENDSEGRFGNLP